LTKALEILLKREKDNYLREIKLEGLESQKQELLQLNKSLERELSGIKENNSLIRKEQDKYSEAFRSIIIQKEEFEKKNIEIFEEVNFFIN
jgi:putative cell wall-binding protein